MKRRVIGITLESPPRDRNDRRYWRQSMAKTLDDKISYAYAITTEKNPGKRFESGLAKAQWEYGLPGTDYYRKDARQAVLELSKT